MLFGLTVPQAAATLATVIIGYNVGLFGDDVLNGTILMMLVTCMLGPWVAERYGRRIAMRAERMQFEPSRAPRRILVPLANPETATHLMDLALLVWERNSGQPIFPLAVVRNQEDVQGGVAAAEKLLGHAVVHAAAADVPVTPVVRVDRNVASGIQRAIQEQLISTVIIGWSGKSSGRQYTFGSVLDQLLERTHEIVFVSKIEQPLATVGRVVLAVPPYAEIEPGFADVVRTVKGLAGQLSAGLLVLATQDRMPDLEKIVTGTRPVVPVKYAPLERWSRLVSTYEAQHEVLDLMVLVSARQGTLAWRPALSRLPRLLANRFPEAIFIACYPPIRIEEAYLVQTRPSGDLVLGGLLSADHITLDVEGRDPDAVLRQMLAAASHDEGALVQRSEGAFSLAEADYVPELMPGVVLYHAHISGLHQPLLFVGISPRGLSIPRSSAQVHVVLALLSPEGGTPESHLRSLALIARLVRAPETIDQLRVAASPEEAREILASSFLVPPIGLEGRPAKARLRNEVPGDALYGNVGVVVSSSSELAPLFSEALHRTITFGKRMHLLHVGPYSKEREGQVRQAIEAVGLSPDAPLHWVDAEASLPAAAAGHEIGLILAEAFEDAGRLDTTLSATAQVLVSGNVASVLLLTRPRQHPEAYRRIVCVVGDDSEALRVYRRVLRLAVREQAEQIYLVRILAKYADARILTEEAERVAGPGAESEHPRRTLSAAQEELEDIVHAGGETGIPVRTFCLEGRPVVAATQFASRYRADLLVMPAIARYAGFADRLYPAESSWTFRDAPCDVWVTGTEG
jgi:mannitol/fructose-specific phosphotransferase system IIA component (Ntr-type)